MTIYKIAATLFALITFCFFFICTFGVIYYFVVRPRYNALMKLYASKNFKEITPTQWFRQLGLQGAYGMTKYFRKLMNNKRILVGRNEYLDNAPYSFAQSLDKKEYAWFYRMLFISKLVDIFALLSIFTFLVTKLLEH